MCGGVLSFVAALLLKRREFSLQLRSKIIDRQIAAHERILKLAQDMRVMGSAGTLGSTVRYRVVLASSFPEIRLKTGLLALQSSNSQVPLG